MLRKTITVATLLGLLITCGAQAANIYKYRDDKGNEFLGSQVPAEYVKNGYVVMDERGRVIKEVSRTLTGTEREEQSEQLALQHEQEEARLKQEAEDSQLLRLYRSPEEVIRRRDSTVAELDDQITALTALLKDAQERVDTLQKRADDNTAASGNVPPEVTSQLEDAVEERDRLSRQVDRIQTERDDVYDTAQKNIDRLKVLLRLE